MCITSKYLLLLAGIVWSLVSASSIAEVKLVLSDPPGRAVLLGVQVQGSVIVNCTGPGNNITWLHNGRHTEASHVDVTKNEGYSLLSIVHYNVIRHDGLWECFSGPYSASVRLDGDEEVPLEHGHRECLRDEYSFCDHAKACHIDPAGDKICFCKKGWTGARCEYVDLDVSKSTFPTRCDGYGIIAFILLIIVILMSLYICRLQCKQRKEKSKKIALPMSSADCQQPFNEFTITN